MRLQACFLSYGIFPSLFPHASLRLTLVFNDTFIFSDVITAFESDYESFHCV